MRLQWPVAPEGLTAAGEAVRLRPLQRADWTAYRDLRADNLEHLRPGSVDDPDAPGLGTLPMVRPAFLRTVRSAARAARQGQSLRWAVEHRGRLAGEMVLDAMRWGGHRSCSAGYWVDHRVSGRGVGRTALWLALEHALTRTPLHRVEVAVSVDNPAGLALAAALGLREEGVRRAAVFVDGRWRDHLVHAVTAPEWPLPAPGRGGGG
ncbi:ribosomal-protein-alanine N-acetyltransferase [Kytococcus aerolatus]|uniref:Ribosomal-protein-alanine N-acetyltransferase n=1 Tax=Kytococcus aerolatus TaxID=592308 RepID=A0A212TCC7_9MICO|nr:GNAT family protein [Kytococcus aerolatus]SNC63688.1 ribosomal-protein-alanine N-acetyltransferase [Kytococcus aerolatus]